jgi:DNA-binding HxlR family transcriptional regulator
MVGTQVRKSYRQFCALARSLDRVGDRWSLLIVRELLRAPSGFAALREALPGLAPNLLVQRLGQMEIDGILRRSAHPSRSKAVRYELTEIGRGLEPALLELIRWGSIWMESGPGSDLVNSKWSMLAIRALLASPDIRKPAGNLLIESEGERVTVTISPAGRTVTLGAAGGPAMATLRGPLAAILALITGRTTLQSASSIVVEGNRSFARAALANSSSR